jgi:hypothetical protein
MASADTAVVVSDTITYRNDARHLADRVAEDIQLTDAAARRRLENAYYVRNQRLGEVQTRYTTDTAGRYVALRTINDETDREVQVIAPDRYNSYESNRARYYDGGPYTVVVDRKPARRGPAVVKYEKDKDGETKIEYANGTKVKIEADGDRKIKRADGSKVKYDEDGRKVK